MKKLIILGICLLLSACSTNKKTTVCEGIVNGINIKVELVHDDTQAYSQSVVNETDYGTMNVSEEEIQELVDEIIAVYNGIEGLTYNYEMKDGILKETITVDYEKGDLDALESVGLVDFGGQEGEDKYIDYPMTVDVYSQMGLTCK